MKIQTITKTEFRADFNRRDLRITNDGPVKAVDTETGELLDGGELRSVKALLDWHIKSGKAVNELVTVGTVR